MNTTPTPSSSSTQPQPSDAGFQMPASALAALSAAAVVPDPVLPTTSSTVKREVILDEPSPGWKAWWVGQWRALVRIGVTAVLLIAVAALIAMVSFIAGGESSRLATEESASKAHTLEVAAMRKALTADAPLTVQFKQGSVEGYGFVRNFFWRNADKAFKVSAVVTTNNDGSRTLKDESIKATTDDQAFQLKQDGRNDTWIPLPSKGSELKTAAPAPKPQDVKTAGPPA